MWKPKLDTAPAGAPCNRTIQGAMAHRRALGGRNLMLVAVAVLLGSALLAGSVIVSNRVTRLRAEIARLESRRGFLEAGSAGLLTRWNKATAAGVITARAERELGLIAPEQPCLVLLQVPGDAAPVSRLQRLLENFGSGNVPAANAASDRMLGTMVSLTPRASRSQGGQ